MSETPERPPNVPRSARWSPSEQVWEQYSLDEFGQVDGEYRAFRRDGSLWFSCVFANGARSGPFQAFHPGGTLAREGQFVEGELDGLIVAYRSDEAGAEQLRPCCVPETARRMHARYERGRQMWERFLDEEGRLLLSDGSLAPTRPEGLPEHASYDELGGRWVCFDSEPSEKNDPSGGDALGTSPGDPAGGLTGTARYFDMNGRLVQEDTYVNDCKLRTRSYWPNGTLRRDESLDSRGRLHGARFVRYGSDEPSPYLDPRIVTEHSEYAHGQPVGIGVFALEGGGELRISRGPACEEVTVLESRAFRAEVQDSKSWLRVAQELEKGGQIREALCVAARAAGTGESRSPLESCLTRYVMPVRTAEASALARSLEQDEPPSISQVLSALLLGAEPGPTLRILSQILPKRLAHAAHDLASAAIVFSAGDFRPYLSRAFRRLELGQVEAALADAARVSEGSEGLAAFVREYAELLFPKWRFLPAREVIVGSFEGMSESPRQSIDQIRRVIQVYATRLGRLRSLALAHLPSSSQPDWLPPLLSELLPQGAVALTRYSARIVDTADDGEEISEVHVDESAALELDGLDEIQSRARSEWAALTWLCWAAGLDGVGLPERLGQRQDFSAAASMIVARAARAQDAIQTGGLRARTQGIPGFEWEGYPIDSAPAAFVRLANEEYAELRALFLWLCFAENHSPFQSDLRAQ
ncbi:MAG TPA: hypothetical protein VFQ61_12125 [Polyangiaceae bacterium]|nr:hypothetical protein [Polyangiaceae bacterium]